MLNPLIHNNAFELFMYLKILWKMEHLLQKYYGKWSICSFGANAPFSIFSKLNFFLNFSMLSKNRKWCHDLKNSLWCIGLVLPVASALFVLRQWFCYSLLTVYCCSHCLVLCLIIVFFLVLQSSHEDVRASWFTLCCVAVSVLYIFLLVPWVDLWSVIGAFPGHTCCLYLDQAPTNYGS